MRKAERLFQLLTLLRGRRCVMTAAQLAQELAVSERTIYRDIQALSLSNIPIEGEAGVGYRLRPGFDIPPLMFEENELEALKMGIQMVQGWSDQALSVAAASALAKIESALPERLHRQQAYQTPWLVVPDFYKEQASQFSEPLRFAIKGQRQIQIQYENAQNQASDRILNPLGLVYWGQNLDTRGLVYLA